MYEQEPIVLNIQENHLNHLSIYRKSMDIFRLSRSIAAYITDDKDVVSMYRSGRIADNYADNLVMNSFRLVPKIAETEIQETSISKLKYAKSLRYFIDRIYEDCLNLEKTKIQGIDFVKMLRKELKMLRKIHKSYVNSIL